jgi:hypothetical protein
MGFKIHLIFSILICGIILQNYQGKYIIFYMIIITFLRGLRGRDRMVVRFTTIYV